MTKRKLYFNLPFLLFLIIGTIYITYQQKSTTYQKSEGKIFGTFYHITYQHNKKLDKEILDELNKVDMALSMFNKESIISRINCNEDVQTNSMFETVYSLAQNVSEETAEPLTSRWHRSSTHGDSDLRPATLPPDSPSTRCVPSLDTGR